MPSFADRQGPSLLKHLQEIPGDRPAALDPEDPAVEVITEAVEGIEDPLEIAATTLWAAVEQVLLASNVLLNHAICIARRAQRTIVSTMSHY